VFPDTYILDARWRMDHTNRPSEGQKAGCQDLSAALAGGITVGHDDHIEGPVCQDQCNAMGNAADTGGPTHGIKPQVQQSRGVRRAFGNQKEPTVGKVHGDEETLVPTGDGQLPSVMESKANPQDLPIGVRHREGPGPAAPIPSDA
jgi:hypothetical protein